MKIDCFLTVLQNTSNLIIKDVPVSSSVIELPGDKLVLVDTGMYNNPEFAAELKDLGYSPGDFAMIINTHLHCDHIGGNRLFKNARIIISKKEYDYECRLNYLLQECNDPLTVLQDMGREVDESSLMFAWELQKLACRCPVSILVGDSHQLEFMEDDPDLPEGISLHSCAGHSIDSRAILLQGQRRNALITGDAFFHRSLWGTVPIPGLHYSEALYRQNSSKIKDFKGIIIPGHDYAFDNITGKYLQEDNFVL